MKIDSTIGAKRLIAIALFAIFMVSSIPMAAVSAVNIVQPANEMNVMVDGNTINEASPSAPDTPARPAGQSEPTARPEREQSAPEEKAKEPVLNERAERPDKTKAEKPVAERPEPTAQAQRPAKPDVSEQVQDPVIFSQQPIAPTPTWTIVSGDVSGTWDLAGSPYYVNGNINIQAGQTLTIEPGVQVIFNNTYSIFVYGTLNAVGTAVDNIAFMSNGFGFWNTIRFEGDSTGSIMYADIVSAMTGVNLNGAENTIDIGFCDFTNINQYGIYVGGLSTCGTNIHGNTFSTGSWAYYESLYFSNTGSIDVGDRLFTGNTVTSNYGYYCNEIYFDNPQTGAAINVGTTTVTWNTLPQVYFNYFGINDMEYGWVSWGDVVIEDNTVSDYTYWVGIYFYGYIQYMTDVSVSLGSFSVQRNDVYGFNYGIYLYSWESYYLYGATSLDMGPMMVSDNTVYAEDYGLYVEYSYIGEYVYDQSYVHADGFWVQDNSVTYSYYWAMYVYVYYNGYEMYHDSTVDIGDVAVTGNAAFGEYDSAMYFYYYDNACYMYENAAFTAGNVDVSSNSLETDYGTYALYYSPYDLACYMTGASHAWFGDFTLTGNTLVNNYGQFACYASISYFGYSMYGDTWASFGDFLFNMNIVDGYWYGFYISDFYYFGTYMGDNAVMTMGNVEFNDNTIFSNRNPGYANGHGLYITPYDFGYYNFGNSQVSMGHMQFNDNDVTVINGNDAYGMYFSYIDYFGSYLYDNAGFVMGGNLEINRNDVSTPGYYGIYYDIYDFGYYMYGNSHAEFQDFQCKDNTVVADDVGIYSLYDYFAYEMYGTSIVTCGNFELTGNDITGDLHEEGIDADWYDMGNYMYDDTMATFGHFWINDNMITSMDGYGIYTYIDYLAYENYDNSICHFGEMQLNNNDIMAYEDGVYMDWYSFGNYMYGNSEAYFLDVEVNDNVVVSTNDDGIYALLDYWAYYCYDNSFMSFGQVEFCRNDITAYDDGFYFDWYYLGYEMDGNSEAYFSDILVNYNTIDTATGDGIYWTDFLYESACYMYSSSVVEFGNIECMWNYIDADSDGIYISSYEYFMYNIDGDSMAVLGDVLFMHNTIYAGDYGFYAYWYENQYDIYDSATCVVGDFQFDQNTVESQDDGVYFDIYEVGAYLYDQSQTTMGDVSASWNMIASGSSCIYLEVEYFGYYVYDISSFTVGSFLINDNLVDTVYYGGSDAIYIYEFDSLAYEVDGGTFEMGNIEIQRNDIYSNDYGIYWYEYYYIAYDAYYGGHVTMGDVLVCDNYIEAYNNYGMYFDDWYYVGYYVDESSVVSLGNYKFNGNTIYSYNECIYFDELNYWGYEMYDSSIMTVGNFEFCGNYLESDDSDGIYFSSIYDFGTYMYASAQFHMGDWLFNDNTIVVDGDGIYWEPYDFGYEMYESTVATFGRNEICRNDITADGNYGLYVWWLYYFGYYMYEDSYAEFGDCVITDNIISAPLGEGIYTGPYDFGEEVYDSAQVVAGDYIVSRNQIDSWDYGIELAVYYIGYDLYGSYFYPATSSVTMGDMDVSENTIYCENDYCIYVYYEYIGEYIYDDCAVYVGEMTINDNDLTGYDGIYLYYDEIAYDVYDSSETYVGSLEMAGNTIDVGANNYGIYLESYYLADSMYDTSWLYIGDILIHDNTILNSYVGIGIYDSYSVYVYDYSYARLPAVKVYNNDVTCVDYGLELIYFSDTSIDSTATAEMPAWEIFDNTFTTEYGMYAGSDGTAYFPAWDIHNNDFYGPGSGSGLYAWNTPSDAPFTMAECNFDNYDYGIQADSNANVRAASCEFTNVQANDLWINSNSNVFMIDCAFDPGNVVYVDGGSSMDLGWYLTVTVETPLGFPVEDAYVTAIANGGWGDWQQTMTDSNGQTVMMLREARYNSANPYGGAPSWNFNDHYVEAQKSVNWAYVSPDVHMDMSKAVTIVLGDSVPPILSGTHYSDAAGTTGDPFNFRIGAVDDMGLQGVDVYYRIGGGAWSNHFINSQRTTDTLTMSPVGDETNAIYESPVTLPHQVGTMEFYFVALDIGGNTSAPSPVWTVPVTDNDAPAIVDNSAAVVTPIYSVLFTATDNIGLTGVYVNYWITGNPVTNVSLGTSGNYNYLISVPYTPGSDLSYFISATDAAGNWGVTPIKTMPIVDSMPPVVVADNSDKTTVSGGPYNFNVTVTDDFGVFQVKAVVWHDNPANAQDIMLIIDNGTYKGSMTVPVTADRVIYFIEAEDFAGNIGTGPIWIRVLNDTTPPTLVSDKSDASATTGDAFTYRVNAADNILLRNVFMIYWFNNNAPTNLTLGGTGSITGVVNVPSAATTLRYYFAVEDAAGNWFVGPTKLISVVDNDAPILGTDSTSATAEAGGTFSFTPSATDNMGITSAEVHYWFGSAAPTVASLNGTTAFTYTITMPTTPGDMSYFFILKDANGNTLKTATKTVKIADTVGPAFGDDGTTGTPTAGQTFTFKVNATDIGGISMVYAVYTVDGGQQFMALMVLKDGSYVGTIVVPKGSTLSYHFVAVDNSGNDVQTAAKSLSINPAGSEEPEEPEQDAAELPWLYIIIIIILIVVVIALIATRPKSGAPAAYEEPAQPTQPAPAEMQVQPEAEQSQPEN